MDYSFYQPTSTTSVYVKNKCDDNDKMCMNNNVKYCAINETVITRISEFTTYNFC